MVPLTIAQIFCWWGLSIKNIVALHTREAVLHVKSILVHHIKKRFASFPFHIINQWTAYHDNLMNRVDFNILWKTSPWQNFLGFVSSLSLIWPDSINKAGMDCLKSHISNIFSSLFHRWLQSPWELLYARILILLLYNSIRL